MTEQENAAADAAVRAVRGAAVRDEDERAVTDGVDHLASGAALHLALPSDLNGIVRAALEAGYGRALDDVRSSRVDGLGPIDDD